MPTMLFSLITAALSALYVATHADAALAILQRSGAEVVLRLLGLGAPALLLALFAMLGAIAVVVLHSRAGQTA